MFRRRILLFFALLFAGGALLLVRLYYAEQQPPERAVAETLVLDVSGDQFFRFCAEYRTDCRTANDTERLGYFLTFLEQELIYRKSFAEGMPWQDPVVQRLLLSNQEYLDIGELTPELLDELVMNDAAIRRHVVRRMRHILSYPDNVEPGREALRAFYAEHASRFTTPARVTLRQYRFETQAAAAASLSLAEASGNDPTGAASTSLPGELIAAGHRDVTRYFGVAFADHVFEMASTTDHGGWQGPVASGLGYHLLQLRDYRPAGTAPFDDAIVNQVQGQWLNAQRDIVYRRRIEALKADALVSLNGSEPVPLPEFGEGDLAAAL